MRLHLETCRRRLNGTFKSCGGTAGRTVAAAQVAGPLGGEQKWIKWGFQGVYVGMLLVMILCWGSMFHPWF